MMTQIQTIMISYSHQTIITSLETIRHTKPKNISSSTSLLHLKPLQAAKTLPLISLLALNNILTRLSRDKRLSSKPYSNILIVITPTCFLLILNMNQTLILMLILTMRPTIILTEIYMVVLLDTLTLTRILLEKQINKHQSVLLRILTITMTLIVIIIRGL